MIIHDYIQNKLKIYKIHIYMLISKKYKKNFKLTILDKESINQNNSIEKLLFVCFKFIFEL